MQRDFVLRGSIAVSAVLLCIRLMFVDLILNDIVSLKYSTTSYVLQTKIVILMIFFDKIIKRYFTATFHSKVVHSTLDNF